MKINKTPRGWLIEPSTSKEDAFLSFLLEGLQKTYCTPVSNSVCFAATQLPLLAPPLPGLFQRDDKEVVVVVYDFLDLVVNVVWRFVCFYHVRRLREPSPCIMGLNELEQVGIILTCSIQVIGHK